MAADRLLRNVIHPYGGPLIHNGSDEAQRSLDSTCRKLHLSLSRPPALSPGKNQIPNNKALTAKE